MKRFPHTDTFDTSWHRIVFTMLPKTEETAKRHGWRPNRNWVACCRFVAISLTATVEADQTHFRSGSRIDNKCLSLKICVVKSLWWGTFPWLAALVWRNKWTGSNTKCCLRHMYILYIHMKYLACVVCQTNRTLPEIVLFATFPGNIIQRDVPSPCVAVGIPEMETHK